MKRSSQRKYSPAKLALWGLWLALLLFCLFHRKDITVDNILRFTPQNRALAALLMLALFAFKGATVGHSGSILYMACGVMFPLPEAVALNMLGTAVMTTIPFFLGQRAGAEILDKLTARYPRLALLRPASQYGGFLFTLALRTAGILPCEPVGMYLGACGVGYGDYIKGSLLGLFPAAVAFTIMGRHLTEPLSPAFLGAAGFQIATSLGTAAAVFFYRRKQKRKGIDHG